LGFPVPIIGYLYILAIPLPKLPTTNTSNHPHLR